MSADNSSAFHRLMASRRPIPDLDEARELAEWREEKFGQGVRNQDRREQEAHPMNESCEFDRITHTPGVMGGKACIRGMRVTVGMIVGQIGAGATIDELLADFPYLEREDITQALRYAAWRKQKREALSRPAPHEAAG